MNHNENRSPTLAMAVSILIIVLIWMIVGIVALKLNVQMVRPSVKSCVSDIRQSQV